MTEAKRKFGGRQEGAGRKPKPLDQQKKQMFVMVEPDLYDWVKRQARDQGKSASQFIEKILQTAEIESRII